MPPRKTEIAAWVSASPELFDAFSDFIMSRQAMMCRERTIAWYSFTLSQVMDWMVRNGVTHPADITAREVREYLADMAARGLKDSTMNNHARTIRTLLHFFTEEKYIPEMVKFKMPNIASKQLRCLTAADVQQILNVCTEKRDKAMILLMVDTGARRAEVCALNWGDMNISSGLIRIVEGKGGKTRSVVVGIETRRALLAYRRELSNTDPTQAVFQTENGGQRLQSLGIRSLLIRLAERSGVKFSSHALRRTFATLSLKAGMNPLHLQALLGHTTLEMTRRYISMIDEDLIIAHQEYGPIDMIVHKNRK
jgi:integrase/recombinase XerD